MSFRNAETPSGVEVVTAAATPVNYVGLTVITASNLVFVDSLGVTTTLTAVPVGTVIRCRIVVVSTCSGVVLGHIP